MDKARLRNLLYKYLNNTCSESEMNELLELFKRAENETEIKAVLSNYWKELSDGNDRRKKQISENNEEWFNEIYTQAVHHEGPVHDKTEVSGRQGHSVKYTYQKRPPQWLKVAAILLFSVMITLFYYTLNNDQTADDVVYEQKVSGPGEKIRFTLSDGTQVHLNSESSLVYKTSLTGEKREVHLRGEGYFVVANDSGRPFLVYTEEVTAKVLGTSFNVRSYPGDELVNIAVTSGKVALSKPELSDSSQQVILEADQWADYTIDSHSFQTGSGNVGYLTAWNEGVLLYHDKQLSEVATQLERWYGVTISFENEKMKECVIRGEHRDETLVNVLTAISYAFDMEYHIEGRNVVLKGAGCDDVQ
jgi:transmembrane sensor